MRKLFVPSAFVSIVLMTLLLSAADKTTSSKTTLPAATDSSLPAPARAAMNSIDPERIRAHVRFLADDLLEGRGTGQRGGDIAAKYIATEFALYGLKPAGDNGTYMQKVPMVGVTTEPQSTFSLVPAQGAPMNLKFGDDYVASNETHQPVTDVDADIVYVGYGIEAPEYKWDDYKGVDVRGKVLLMLVNEPPSNDPNFFKGKALTYYGRWTYKYEEGARKGALGVILIHKTDMASYGWDVVRNSWGGEKDYLKENNQPALPIDSWVTLDVARKIFSDSGKDLNKMMQDATSRDFHPVPLPVKLKAHLVSKIRDIQSSNVVALLPGSDPKLKDQAVMYTAHYDHLGIHSDMAGDNIYNGAADNATGCGILLELARAYAQSAEKPKRSIVFAAVTAEEQGLLGSEYLGQHPPIPAGQISLDLNFDDVPPIGTPEQTTVAGAERTTFYPVVETTAKQFGLGIVPDARPEAGHYYRSDHFSLARVGIPSFSINEGTKYKGHTNEWGLEQAKDYNEHRYHQPSDEYRPDMDFDGDAEMARFGFDLGWKAANMPAVQ
ncbi:MAG TPA: M28 family metallopeptidase, partial [Terriglobales bacterium]|nr:M28 family metallopeptidase [Terriglobales bacterium]